MNVLNGLAGGIVGGEITRVVSSLLESHGGLQGLLGQFQKAGLGTTVQSWVGSGPNQAISADQVHQALGADAVQRLTSSLGISQQDLLGKLASALPQVVDKLTPGGLLPASQP